MESNAVTGMKWESVWIVAVGLLLSVAAWAVLFVNPLPSDEEMISHFRDHRSEIDALVTRYRTYQRSEPSLIDWNDLPEVVALRERSGVDRVAQSGPIWLPHPYSAETAQHLHLLARAAAEEYAALRRKRGSLKVELRDRRYGLRSAIVRTSLAAAIWKEYFFFPEAPKIDQQRLWYPADIDGQLKSSDRVLTSLNWYPPGWRKGECVFRSIESQWFIRMCWGA